LKLALYTSKKKYIEDTINWSQGQTLIGHKVKH